MEVFFFYRNNSCNRWFNAALEAWGEDDKVTDKSGEKICHYDHLETIHIHIGKHPKRFHCCTIRHEFGRDDCMGDSSRSRDAFLKRKLDRNNSLQDFTLINHRTFNRFRKVMLNLHRRYPPINYAEVAVTEVMPSRIIF
ncbi:MAG TPA: hypothetical protein VI757_11785 [Bacteroidia bacterium]|nr:hypothetical protein [Bacteroidia bacterium]